MTTPSSDDQVSAVPAFYFNGFQLGLSNADVNCVLMLNNLPAVSLNMSYTTAKTLHVALGEMIATLESVTGRDIMTTHVVGAGLEKIGKEAGSQ